MNTINETPKKRSLIRRLWPHAAVAVVALTIGAAAGGAGGTAPAAAPQPAKTIEVEVVKEVEVPAEVDTAQLGACQRAVEELRDIALASNQEVSVPYGEVVMILHGELTTAVEVGAFAVDVDAINQGSALLGEIGAAAGRLADRATAIGGDYNTCVG